MAVDIGGTAWAGENDRRSPMWTQIAEGRVMELRAVQCFVVVADAGTVTAGAARLGIGQPAVSRQIQQLERQLRIQLFDREDGRLRLTSAGIDVLPVARRLLRQADAVTAAARGVAAGRLQRVRLVSPGTTRDDVLAPWLATWQADAPLPSIAEAAVDDVYGALRGGADLAVAPIAPPRGLASRIVAELPLWACVAPTHPWADRTCVDLAELAGADLLLLDRTFHARRVLDAALDEAHLGAEPRAEFASPVVAQAVAASGRGVCVLTDDPRFGLVPLGIRDPGGGELGIRLHAAWDRRHHASMTLEALAADLAGFTRSRYSGEPHPGVSDSACPGPHRP